MSNEQTITLHHGTNIDAAQSIMADGFYPGRVYLTSRYDIADEYGCGAVLLVTVPISSLREDYDTENPDEGMTALDWAESGRSVYVDAASILSIELA